MVIAETRVSKSLASRHVCPCDELHQRPQLLSPLGIPAFYHVTWKFLPPKEMECTFLHVDLEFFHVTALTNEILVE